MGRFDILRVNVRTLLPSKYDSPSGRFRPVTRRSENSWYLVPIRPSVQPTFDLARMEYELTLQTVPFLYDDVAFRLAELNARGLVA